MHTLTRPRSVLILDDDEVDRMILRRCLSKAFEACVFTEASNQAEFLEQLSKSAPDLIISDVNLKPDTGFDVARKATASLPEPSIPFIFMSGIISDAHRERAREFYPYCVIEKPTNSKGNAAFCDAVMTAFNAPRNGSDQPKPV